MPRHSQAGPARRVVLVDCYANDRTFIRDTSFRALAERLRGRGVETSLVDLVRDDAPEGRALADVAAAVRAARPSVLVASRAWSTALVGELRAAAGEEALLIRCTRGASSAIDDAFDEVLDAEGVLARVAGGEVTPPAWRRTRREMATAHDVPADAEAGERPYIAGPARGCPFLVDVRTSPAYRDSGIDFDSVQSKGCSFCLDNVGAFAAFPAEQVVGTWLDQLRALRSERPAVREVLLTDERPHPFLPDLFRAIAAEPALHGIELLVKSRVDWLAEHSEGALREACELAEQSGSVLHLYLVGFESFHQADLDLFNKAVSVEDNLRAIEILREMEIRHPRSFAFRRHRAHGIVLFHPWTTPESLLDNARAMRETRFHELRSQALRTRLRVYPSVPLHALAERDGLLVEDFDQGRPDRALEQGYDASVAWKFADARVEAIFRCANSLASFLPDVIEADVLEMATRFVVRRPEFARVPELAVYPVLQALFTWGASPAAVVEIAGASVACFDREVEAVAAGSKQACLKESVARADVEKLIAAYELMGLAAAVVSTHERGTDDGEHRRGESHCIVAVAGEGEALAQVLREQRAVERGERDRIPAMGRAMGYPACCVEAFRSRRTHGGNLDLERAPFRAHPERPLEPLLNRFAGVSLISHMLCAPDCRASRDAAVATLDAVALVDGDAARRVADHLTKPVLRLDYRRAATVEGAWQGDRYQVRAMHPLAGAALEIDPGRVTDLRLSDRGVSLRLAGGASRFLASPAPMLVEPGRPIAASMLRAIAHDTSEGQESQHGGRATGNAHSAGGADERPIAEILARGTAVGDHAVATVESDGESGYLVVLEKGASRIRVRLRKWDPSRPAVSRRGSLAFDLEPPREPSEGERKILGALARRLPAGHRHDGCTPEMRPSRHVRNTAARGVLCTAPWTTLEVVDPDGLVRQCCADWTAGDRGNLHASTLREVWNGAGYRAARRIMAGEDVSALCHAICPRLYDEKFAERELSIVPGAEAFVANQQILIEDIAERREEVRASPLYVAVCPSTYCNYDCIMCTHGRTPRRELSESIWDELLAMLPTLRVLTLLGGEPLANPAAMRFLRSWNRDLYPDAAVSVVTNGSLLTPAVIAHLERCSFANVTISLNAGTALVYERVQRGSSSLEEVVHNTDALIELRRRQGSDFPIVLSFVVQPANCETLIDFMEIARGRRLPIRLMPLSPEGVEHLDFYGDDGEIARVEASLRAAAQWAERAAPDYLSEIRAARAAILGESARRRDVERTVSAPVE